MSASTVPTVRAALVTRFASLLTAGGDSTPVVYGHPGMQVPRAFVSVSTTTDGLGREQRTLPLRQSQSRTETYDLRVIVWHLVGEQDGQQTVVERAWRTFDLLDTGLRGDPSLSGLVTSALFTRVDDDDLVLNEGRAAQLLCSLSVTVNRA